MSKNNETQNIEIATLKEWKRSFDKFVRNELAHINTKIDRIESKIFYGLIIATVGIIVAQILLKFFA